MADFQTAEQLENVLTADFIAILEAEQEEPLSERQRNAVVNRVKQLVQENPKQMAAKAAGLREIRNGNAM